MPRKLTDRQFLALGYLAAQDRVTARDLPMNHGTARSVLVGLTRKGYAAEEAPGSGSYTITDAGRPVLAAAREAARRDAGLS
jgi:DNA-binding IclR family transcriptional regulator